MRNVRTIYQPSGAAGEYAPFALNLAYGCTFGCRYCFARAMALRGGLINRPDDVVLRWEILDHLSKACLGLRKRKYGADGPGLFSPAPEVALNEPVLLCFMTDPYQNVPGLADLRRQCLEILIRYNLPIKLLSKAGSAMLDDFDLLAGDDPARHWVGSTITTSDEGLAAWVEPGAAPPLDRAGILAIAARDYGLNTWVSIEPGLIGAHALAVIELCAKVGVHHIAVGILSKDIAIPAKFKPGGEPVCLHNLTNALESAGYRQIGLPGMAERGNMPPAQDKTYYVKNALAVLGPEGSF